LTEPKRSFTPRGFENFLEMYDTKNQRVCVRESSVDDDCGGKCIHIFCDEAGMPMPGGSYPSPHLSVDQAERLAWALAAFVARERNGK